MIGAYWGKRAGGYFETKRPKGSTQPWGLVINIKRRGPSSNNSVPKVRHYTKILSENARRRKPVERQVSAVRP